jgi:hypothetical protein
MIAMLKSAAIRFVSPALIAERVISRPTIIGPNRAGALFNLATNGATRTRRALGRRALQVAARAAGRHVAASTLLNDRVFNKASNARLRNWAQNLNTPV